MVCLSLVPVCVSDIQQGEHGHPCQKSAWKFHSHHEKHSFNHTRVCSVSRVVKHSGDTAIQMSELVTRKCRCVVRPAPTRLSKEKRARNASKSKNRLRTFINCLINTPVASWIRGHTSTHVRAQTVQLSPAQLAAHDSRSIKEGLVLNMLWLVIGKKG